MVLKPGSEKIAERVFRKWELDFSVIGYTTDTGHLVVRHRGIVESDIPLAALAHAAPVYERPWTKKEPQALVAPEEVPSPLSPHSSEPAPRAFDFSVSLRRPKESVDCSRNTPTSTCIAPRSTAS